MNAPITDKNSLGINVPIARTSVAQTTNSFRLRRRSETALQ